MDKLKVFSRFYKHCGLLLLGVFLCSLSAFSFALPFNIVPNGSLPTSVPLGTTVAASYTVTNNTGEQRNNNYVQSLQTNVSLTGGTCTTNFNLAPFGQAGDSCTLNLTISGPDNINDTNPLLVCFPGGITCAGTLFRLSVAQAGPVLSSIAITPTTPSVAAGLSQQFTAIGTFSDGSTQNITSSVNWNSATTSVATINSTGLATSIATGSSVITASSGSINSNSAILTVTAAVLQSIAVTPASPNIIVGGTQQFTATGTLSNSTTTNLTSSATWHSSSTGVATINSTGLATGVSLGSSNITATSGLITSNTDVLSVVKFAYIVNNGANTVSSCAISNTDSSLVSCTTAGTGFNSPIGITLNSSRSIAYVANNGGSPGSISNCPVNANSLFGTCTTTGSSIQAPLGITLNPAGTYAYIVNGGNNTIIFCVVNGNGTFGTCSNTNGNGYVSPVAVAINAANTFAFVTDNNSLSYLVWSCPIKGDGSFGTCVNTSGTGFNIPSGIALNPSGTFAYITNNGGNSVSFCPISSGTFGSCGTTGSGFTTPYGIAVNSANTFAYVTNNTLSTVIFCAVNSSDKSLSACNTTGTGFSSPAGIFIS